MPIPSNAEQVKVVMAFLDSQADEERSLEEIATEIVNGYHDAITKGIKKPAQPVREGMLYKTPVDTKVWRVAWTDWDSVWLVTETSQYGMLGHIWDNQWEFCEEFRPRKRMDGKLVEMTDEMIAEAWSNPDWNVGDSLSRSQRAMSFEIIATAPVSVLMMGSDGNLYSESNSNLKRYYKRDIKVSGIQW